MDIAAMSMSISQTQLQQSVQTSVLKGAMETQEQMAMQMISEMMPAPPPSNYIIDVYA